MSRLSYYLDENVHHGPIVAKALRDRGIDAITADEAGRSGLRMPDEYQLDYATRQGRVMVSQDLRFRPRPRVNASKWKVRETG